MRPDPTRNKTCGHLQRGSARPATAGDRERLYAVDRNAFGADRIAVLRLLVQHAGKALTHKMILRDVWGVDTDVQYLRIYIRALRQKIEPDPERPVHILTETGVGYRLRIHE